MSESEEQKDFQIWAIEPSDHVRKIEFKGKLILIFNRETKDTAVDEDNVNIVQEYKIEKGYECELHGGGVGSFARLSDIA
ncbi:hypothetical protein CJF30_00011151 [Rutstroemia sp. NJR-2017a BBW]|nr:hypothetical protein CJF30_00011151 [Rutstroemia sp. NJR-2017a BBW]